MDKDFRAGVLSSAVAIGLIVALTVMAFTGSPRSVPFEALSVELPALTSDSGAPVS